MSLVIIPCALDAANAFVEQHHRHHRRVRGHKFSIAVVDANGDVRGVAIVGRPVARHRDDGWTLEVTRCCTDGTRNASSALYGAARRATFALGYRQLVTYTLASESGVSLRAAGYRVIAQVQGRTWDRPKRPRIDKHPTDNKLCWMAAGATA